MMEYTIFVSGTSFLFEYKINIAIEVSGFLAE